MSGKPVHSKETKYTQAVQIYVNLFGNLFITPFKKKKILLLTLYIFDRYNFLLALRFLSYFLFGSETSTLKILCKFAIKLKKQDRNLWNVTNFKVTLSDFGIRGFCICGCN